MLKFFSFIDVDALQAVLSFYILIYKRSEEKKKVFGGGGDELAIIVLHRPNSVPCT